MAAPCKSRKPRYLQKSTNHEEKSRQIRQDANRAGITAWMPGRPGRCGEPSGPSLRCRARQKALGGSVEDWATESLLAAREAYRDPAAGRRIKPETKLADDYQTRSLPVAKRRLYRAGVRLASVLNEIF
jgi:hypothetical protein